MSPAISPIFVHTEGDGADIGAGATVRDSIVAGRIGAAAEVDGSVIGPTYEVPDRAVVVDERLPRSAP